MDELLTNIEKAKKNMTSKQYKAIMESLATVHNEQNLYVIEVFFIKTFTIVDSLHNCMNEIVQSTFIQTLDYDEEFSPKCRSKWNHNEFTSMDEQDFRLILSKVNSEYYTLMSGCYIRGEFSEFDDEDYIQQNKNVMVRIKKKEK